MKTQIIRGNMGGKGGDAPVEEDDSLASRQTLRVLYALSNGIIKSVSEIYINKVKLETTGPNNQPNIKGVLVETRLGDSNTPPILGFSSVETTSGITYSGNITRNAPKTIAVSSTIDRIRIIFTISRLFIADAKGNITHYTLSIKLTPSYDSNTFPIDKAITIKKTGKASNAYAFDVNIAKPVLSAGSPQPTQWFVKVERITEDDDADSVKRLRYSDVIISSVIEIEDVKLQYPGTALLGLTFSRAKRLGNSFPELIFRVEGIKIPVPSSTYYKPTATTTSGQYPIPWNLTSWALPAAQIPSANPSWILLYLLRDTTYGLGIPDTDIDMGAFYSFAKYCDELIPAYAYEFNDASNTWSYEAAGFEKRYEVHNQFTEQEPAIQFLSYIYNAGLAKPIVTPEGLHSVTWDRPRLPSVLITNDNVIDGLFVYGSNSLEERYTNIIGIYNDINKLGTNEVITIPLSDVQTLWEPEEIELAARYPYKVLTLPLVGCTSRNAAIRRARWALYRNSILTNTITFSVLFDGLYLEIGNIIKIADSFANSTLIHGVIVESTVATRTITLDRPVTLSPTVVYTIEFYTVNGLVKKEITSSGAGITEIRLNTTFEEPLQGSVFLISTSMPDESLWEIIGLSYNSDSKQITVSCIQYSDKLYEYMERPITVGPNKVYKELTAQNTGLSKVTGLNVTPRSLPGYPDALYVYWNKPDNMIVSSYTLEYRNNKTNGDFTKIQDIETTQYTLENLSYGSYTFRVYAKNIMNMVTEAAEVSYSYTKGDLKVYSFTRSIAINDIAETVEYLKFSSSFKVMGVEFIYSDPPINCRLRMYKHLSFININSGTITPITDVDATEKSRPFKFSVSDIPKTTEDITSLLPFLDIKASESGKYTFTPPIESINDSLYTFSTNINQGASQGVTILLSCNSETAKNITVKIYYKDN